MRASPTCGAAGRRRGHPDADGSRGASSLRHLVGQDAEAGDRDLDLVTHLHRADALGGAGEDDVAGQQGHHAGDLLDQGGDVEDHVAGVAVLLEVAVEVGLHADAVDEVLRVEVGLDPRAERAEGVEALGPGELHVGALQVARGHVVGDGVAEDHVGRLRGRDLAADPADHHGQLALEVQVLGLLRVADRLARPDHAGVGLEEQQRLVGYVVAELGGVGGVVAADPDHLAARQHRREQPDVGELVLLLGRLDPGVERVAGERDDDGVVRRLAVLVELAGDHAVERVVPCREPCDAHGGEPIERVPPLPTPPRRRGARRACGRRRRWSSTSC